ncbi:MAG: metal ABC transporter permease [Planctomycetes bacterium]|nr:metal ABC transporter permease [Planctomycetota bacterium]
MPFLEYNTAIVLGGTTLLGFASGVIGVLGLLRRRALLGDALAHATLPGICLAFLLFGRQFGALLFGALVTGIAGVALVALLSRYTRIKEDANIGIVLSVFFGGGLALSTYIQKNSVDAAQAGINGFILGRTAGMVQADLIFICTAAVAVCFVVLLFYKEFKLLCFDPDFAAVEGWPVVRLDFLLMLLLAVTVVIGLPAVGIVLMVAMLIVPPAAARFWVAGLAPMMWLAGAFGALTGAAGSLTSTYAADLPAGPVIVLCGSALFLISLLFAPRRGILARARDRRRWRKRRAIRGFLRILYEASEAALPERAALPIADLLGRFPGRAREAEALVAHAARAGWLERAESEERAALRRSAPRAAAAAEGDDAVRLTAAGLQKAAEAARIHRLWQHYLRTSAHIDRDIVDPDAEEIESILPRAVLAQLEEDLKNAGTLPGGGAPVRALAGLPRELAT